MARKRPELDKSATVAELPEVCASEPMAVAFFEKRRWGDTPCCCHCGSVNVYAMRDRLTGERNRRFLWRCRDCSKQYTVRTGTVFEESLIPLHKWARAFWQAASNKNGGSALELARQIQVTPKTALFMLHRIRWAMTDDPSTDPKLSGTIEADTTFVGGKPRYPRKGKMGPDPTRPKTAVLAVLERGGDVKTRVMPSVTVHNLRKVLGEFAEAGSDLITDDRGFRAVGREMFKSHKSIKHSTGEYVRKSDPTVHTNTVEGFFSRVKRSLNGTYHAVSREHLHRYVTQAAFLYNCRAMTDGDRVDALIRKAQGKRLVYRQTA